MRDEPFIENRNCSCSRRCCHTAYPIAGGGSDCKYTDDKTVLDFNDIHFRGDRIEIIKNREVVIKDVFQFLKSVSFSGKLAARQLSSHDFQLENLSAALKNENGMLSGDPIALKFLGSDSKLRASLDLRQAKSKFVSDWNVVRGVAHARDVAFSTDRHRVAIEGRLDFPNQRFGNVIIAAVDAKGCIVNKEALDGPFDKPEIKEAGVVQRTLLRPLKKFFAPTCDKPFYTGSVGHPSTGPGKQ